MWGEEAVFSYFVPNSFVVIPTINVFDISSEDTTNTHGESSLLLKVD
jgi:hypothetical protein